MSVKGVYKYGKVGVNEPSSGGDDNSKNAIDDKEPFPSVQAIDASHLEKAAGYIASASEKRRMIDGFTYLAISPLTALAIL